MHSFLRVLICWPTKGFQKCFPLFRGVLPDKHIFFSQSAMKVINWIHLKILISKQVQRIKGSLFKFLLNLNLEAFSQNLTGRKTVRQEKGKNDLNIMIFCFSLARMCYVELWRPSINKRVASFQLEKRITHGRARVFLICFSAISISRTNRSCFTFSLSTSQEIFLRFAPPPFSWTWSPGKRAQGAVTLFMLKISTGKST